MNYLTWVYVWFIKTFHSLQIEVDDELELPPPPPECELDWPPPPPEFENKWIYFDLFVLILDIPVNDISVMLGCLPVCLGWTSTKPRIMYLAHWHNTVSSMRL